MRLLIPILALFLATATCMAAETVDESLPTGEVMAFGLNTYLVYLEISELTASDPSWILGASGAVVGGATLLLKDYDGTLFGHFLTGVAAADLLMGGYLYRKGRRAEGLSVVPLILESHGEKSVGLCFRLRF